MKVSVILPVFNGEKFIAKAIESVLSQSLSDFELIVVNDGSTDATSDIINGFSDSRIKVINQSNQGPGASRNNALKVVSGEYVMFLDSDDWYCPDALRIAYNQANENDTDISIFQIIKYYQGKYSKNDWFSLSNFPKEFENRVFNPHECRDFLFDISVSVPQKIFKREFLAEINAGFPEGIYFEDMPFFFYTFLNAKRVSIIKEYLYVRRKHHGSITESVDSKFLDTVRAGQILMDIFIENEWYDMYLFDLIAFKINGPRYALMGIEEKCKEKLFILIKKDYESIKSSEYYHDYMDNMGPKKKKFFSDVLKASDFQEYKKLLN
ncbi:glycosyltransferase family 2 protein [Methanobrevibacter sp.]|uniref:glycosyltransferase family 2 protein n=1 Tax=Methanobrevibacter sp. TaxID=66852 RepID=UPI0025CE9AFA|nr:glycosyltransferase family 2 protein [Methanobrevibacter sp.]MBQ2831201.1 glycosyltransferase family 2 protein [Methanobrevibacter sp.]